MKNNSDERAQTFTREAMGQDISAIVKLIRQLGDDCEVTEEYVQHYLSGTDRCILLAERDEIVVGLLSYSMRADLFHAGISVLIEELVVDEGCRGNGIGGMLVDELMKRAQRLACKEICLAVMPDNDEAIRFYKRHGLVEEALFLEKHFIP
jgi:ribosomal protein S18 acetylase RimI-like enzyme